MKKSLFSALVFMIGIWLIVFQVPGVSYSDLLADTGGSVVDTASAKPPYRSTGFPQVVVVSGTNYEMGVQYGRETAPAIFHNVAIFKSKLYDAYGSETVTKDMQVWDYYIRKFDPTLVDWIRGISRGCLSKRFNVSYLDLVLLMVYPTELWARPSDPYPPETHMRAQKKGTSLGTSEEETAFHSCNSFAATGSATPNGKPIHGITTMVSAEGMDNAILIAFPNDGASFVSQTWPGRVNGNAGMNSDGFAWSMTAILIDKPAWGLTEVYFHYLAQLAKSPEEAVNYIKSTPFGGVAGGFVMSDAKGNVSVFEVAPDRNDHYNLRVPGDVGEPGPWVVQTNHLVAPSLQADNPFWLTFIGTYPRYDTVFQFLTEAAPNSVDFSFAKNMFASDDWYDAVAKQWHYNDPGALGISNNHTSVSQSIFFPADLIAYLQTGTPSGNGLPAYATGEYVRIKLAKDPKKVTDQADADALAFYWDATEFFEHDLNANAPYLTASLAQTVMDNLDEAFSAYSLGMDRAAFAYLETNVNKQLALYGEALTYYAKAQLYSQMAKTMLLRAKGSQ